ncbi:MAG TPA: nuclear transport factor 2 family protein [Nocardioidaceae bacterium]
MRAFREAVESWDIDKVVSLMTEDVTFRSPVVHKPYQGRDAVAVILHAVSRVFADFRYDREIHADDGADHALVFRARVGDREVEGCDFLHVNEAGQVDEFFVMIRPLSGVLAVAEAMRAELERADPSSPV